MALTTAFREKAACASFIRRMYRSDWTPCVKLQGRARQHDLSVKDNEGAVPYGEAREASKHFFSFLFFCWKENRFSCEWGSVCFRRLR